MVTRFASSFQYFPMPRKLHIRHAYLLRKAVDDGDCMLSCFREQAFAFFYAHLETLVDRRRQASKMVSNTCSAFVHTLDGCDREIMASKIDRLRHCQFEKVLQRSYAFR